MSIDDSQFYEKIRKEAEDSRIDSSFKQANSVHSNLDDFYERKISFFEKMVNTTSTNRLKYPNLSKTKLIKLTY